MAKTNFNADWPKIEAEYRAALFTVPQLSARHQVPIATITARIRRDGWVKDPTARHDIIQEKVCDVLGQDFYDDAKDIAKAIENARKSLMHVSKMLSEEEIHHKDLKSLSETNRVAIDTIMRVRGLSDKGHTVEDMNEEQLRAELQRLQKIA